MLKKLMFLSAFLLILIVLAGCQDNQAPITGPDTDVTGDASTLLKGGHNSAAVYTLSNSAAGNEVILFTRNGQGYLSPAGSYSTGGLGTGSGLGSQGAVVLSGKFLFAVNAGSDEVSVLGIHGNHLTLTDKVSSGGTKPISLTVHRNL
ncbi:MAG: hypothetical protein P8X73_17415, partial [Ignavibacteriaceae bacterium]